jgi:hypothetical protein
MGQYYKCIVLKKDWKETQKPIRAALSPYDFDNGAKLMEHSYVRNNYVSAFMHLVHELDKDRSGLPCVWCGDYADTFSTEGLPLFEKMNTDTQKPEIVGGFNAYNEAYAWINKGEEKSDEYKEVLNLIEDYNMHNYRYIINHTKKEYVKVPAYEKDKWIIHPLPILLADGNGRGGGDYHDEICTNPEEEDLDKREYVKKPNAKFVGAWAYDTISVTNNEADAKGYTKIDWEDELEY